MQFNVSDMMYNLYKKIPRFRTP